MKTFNIMLLSTLGNLLLIFGVLVAINMPDMSRFSQTNWLTFAPLAVLYAVLVALIGLGLGSLVNGLLVYPKKRWRNLRMREINAGIICLLLVLYFAWATGSFHSASSKTRPQSWMHADLLYRDISERGFKAF